MESKELLNRKSIRLKNYDYSKPGYYFITICTENRIKTLGKIIGDDLKVYPDIELTKIGLEVKKSLANLSSIIKNINIDQYTIMPNHVHFVLSLNKTTQNEIDSDGFGNPQLHYIVGRFKSYTTYQYNIINSSNGVTLWQRSFFDHIIRNESELMMIREYIENNPLKWREDKYYIE